MLCPHSVKLSFNCRVLVAFWVPAVLIIVPGKTDMSGRFDRGVIAAEPS